MRNNNIIILILILYIIPLLSCDKEFLEEKPDRSLVVPNSIKDLQAILDNPTGTSTTDGKIAFNNEQPALMEISSGDFIVTDAAFTAGQITERNSYNWAKEIFESLNQEIEWNWPYQRVYYSNLIIEEIKKISIESPTDVDPWNNVMGGALFFRAYNHFVIAQQFCKAYDQKTSKEDLGIPLRLNPSFTEPTTRSSVEETYQQIIKDLNASLNILPVSNPETILYKLRPTKTAALAMLARVYLSMSEYDSAYLYSDKALKLYSKLENFKDFDSTQLFNPIKQFNNEVIFLNAMNNYGFLNPQRTMTVAPALYDQYDIHDLRKKIFFDKISNRTVFKGSYWGNIRPLFTGLATDELFLIRAECLARGGDITESMNNLNALLITRWREGYYINKTANNTTEALNQILQERRKELCFRGLRWQDLRRLNKEPDWAITLTRVVNGTTYSLQPNDPRYVFPIPPNVISLSGMPQNER